MPPRGYRDETKWLRREIAESAKVLAKIGNEDQREYYKRQLARDAEEEARSKAAYGPEPDLLLLVRIAVLQDRDRISPHAAAREIADQFGGNARQRHANTKRLHRKFQKAPALYRRLATSDDPAAAAYREISEYLEQSFNRWSTSSRGK
jgi:hypothetical protein